jgi:orotidine-5'-phosphate decarboxylase
MEKQKNNPVICAIDTVNVADATHLSRLLTGNVGALKLGLEFFTANGAAGVRQIVEQGLPVFLDLKFHDIPNTVAKAIKATAAIDAFMMTVHTAGGKAMMRGAADAAAELAKRPLIVGVTVLTSLDQEDIKSIGVTGALPDQVKRLADLAQSSGLDGVVCSPQEITLLRGHCGKDFKLVVPGIRPEGSASGDQKRVMTPRQALQAGADYLVIGRPITEAADPQQAAAAILNSLSS